MKSSVKAVSKPSIVSKKVESSESSESDSSSSDEDNKNVNLSSIYIKLFGKLIFLVLVVLI